jgi:hypothetical protein
LTSTYSHACNPTIVATPPTLHKQEVGGAANSVKDDYDCVSDDDSWMEMDVAELERMVKRRYGGGDGGSSGSGGGPDLAAAAAAAAASMTSPKAVTREPGPAELDELVRSMTGFVNNQSTHEGAEFDGSGRCAHACTHA